eukprot:749291-Hanusia_phi.AAC.5
MLLGAALVAAGTALAYFVLLLDSSPPPFSPVLFVLAPVLVLATPRYSLLLSVTPCYSPLLLLLLFHSPCALSISKRKTITFTSTVFL